MNTNEQRAQLIASKANEFGKFIPEWEAGVKAYALELLQQAYRAGADSVRNSPDYNYKEDMGR